MVLDPCLKRVSGENKIHFIPGMIGPFLGVTLVPQVEVRNIMIPIFHDMMDWEQRKNGNFKQVQEHTLSCTETVQVVHRKPEEVSVCVCVCRWRLSWLTSWTVWCRRGKETRTTGSSSVCCEERRLWLPRVSVFNLERIPLPCCSFLSLITEINSQFSALTLSLCVCFVCCGTRTQLFGPYPRYDTPCTWADIRC